ncbi:hypothetical protein ACFQZ4_15795 [Catellatospora coxensis]
MKQIVKRLLPRPALRAAAYRLPLRQRVRIAKLLVGGPSRTRSTGSAPRPAGRRPPTRGTTICRP